MKATYVLIVSIILCSTLFAQEQNKYALSFGIADNFQLSSFNGQIAAKKIINDTHQLRVFLSPSFSANNSDSNTESEEAMKTFYFSLGIGADYLRILIKNNKINLFAGPGLGISFQSNKSEHRDNTIKSTSVDNRIDLALRGVLGVEWKVTNQIGIHCEYLLIGAYIRNSGHIKSEGDMITDQPKTTSSFLSLGPGVLFGVSVYF
jgi:hypothetical protein